MTEVVVWNGFIGGIGVGLVTLLMFLIFGEKFGASTGFGNVCSIVSKRTWFHTGSYADAPNNWRLWFLIGLPLGGVIAALTSGGSIMPTVSMGALYDSVLPSNMALKGLWLLGSGIAMGIGARLAGGCTSGHSISGMALLNPPSILASAGFFVGGIVAVQAIFRIAGGG